MAHDRAGYAGRSDSCLGRSSEDDVHEAPNSLHLLGRGSVTTLVIRILGRPLGTSRCASGSL